MDWQKAGVCFGSHCVSLTSKWKASVDRWKECLESESEEIADFQCVQVEDRRRERSAIGLLHLFCRELYLSQSIYLSQCKQNIAKTIIDWLNVSIKNINAKGSEKFVENHHEGQFFPPLNALLNPCGGLDTFVRRWDDSESESNT